MIFVNDRVIHDKAKLQAGDRKIVFFDFLQGMKPFHEFIKNMR